MTDDQIPAPEVGPWAKEKLDALERYLDYYTKRLKNHPHWHKIYLDAFAGGGHAKVRRRPTLPSSQNSLWDEEPSPPEVDEFVSGSPRRALQLVNPFDSYIFIDADPARISMLKQLKKEYGDGRRITIRKGDADDEVAWVLSFNPTKTKHRGVAFLDPFGAHLSWSTILDLAKTGVFEVIVNFPLHMCLNRLMTRNPDEIRPTWRAQLDAFLPSGWYDQAYETVHEILGEQVRKRSDALDRLLPWYRRQLGDAFGFVSEARLIRNTQGGPLYYLLWAGPNEAGLAGANYIMRMGEVSLI
jgi:three-Cys-motif partner protein